jgi:hypothetical protein
MRPHVALVVYFVAQPTILTVCSVQSELSAPCKKLDEWLAAVSTL